MNKITQVTRRDIVESLQVGFDEDIGFGMVEHHSYHFWGRLTPVAFLKRLYPLDTFPSKDPRYKNAESEINAHTVVHPDDYQDGWVFEDERFDLKTGPDELFLNFLCEIFHPEVRDDSADWNKLYERIKALLDADGYELYVKDQMSRRNIYGWRDKTIPRFKTIRNADINCFTDLLIRQGTVVGFYRKDDFDDFTNEVIGIRLCEQYGPSSSKGSALRQYIDDCMDEAQLLKLFSALIKHYESDPSHVHDDARFFALHKRCRGILDRACNANKILFASVETLKRNFSSEYLATEMDLMLKMVEENPTEAIGKAKELIESCCKTILEANSITVGKNWDVSKLVTETTQLLRITPKDIPENIPMAATMRKLLGNLRAIAEALTELRNAYGSGHGKSATYKGLQPRHAKLAVGSSSTLVHFLWDSFQRQQCH